MPVSCSHPPMESSKEKAHHPGKDGGPKRLAEANPVHSDTENRNPISSKTLLYPPSHGGEGSEADNNLATGEMIQSPFCSQRLHSFGLLGDRTLWPDAYRPKACPLPLVNHR